MRVNSAIAAAAGCAIASAALAGGGPDNVLLIIDPSDPDSLHIGNAYAEARGLPEGNVLYLRPWADNHQDFADQNLEALFGELAQRKIAGRIDYILVAPTDQYRLSASSTIVDSCSPVTRFSVSSCYTMAFVAEEVLGGLPVEYPNRYHYPVGDHLGFDSETAYSSGQPSTAATARRYFIGCTLGYTRDEGNTVDEVLEMIDRSVTADGSFPSGRFFFMNNEADPARNVRATSYSRVIGDMQTLGADAMQVDGRLPSSPPTALGVMTGFSSADIVGAGFDMAPGAFADHLTSYAGVLSGTSQTVLSNWVRKGASGSAGAVQEPCNYPGKFPHPRLHLFYYQGASLGEAYLRSARYLPFQIMLYGDPITRPFAHIPVVRVPDLPSGAVSGSIQITPEATTSHPAAGIEQFEVYLNGALLDAGAPGTVFQIDTTLLPEGPCELRVVATDDTDVASAGVFAGDLLVDNDPRSATLAPDVSMLSLGGQTQLTASAPGAREIRIVQHGRVVGSIAGDSGIVPLYGQSLGAGPVALRAIAEFDDGSLVRSDLAQLTVTPDGATSGALPQAFGYTRTVDPAAPFVLELPASYDDSMRDASYAITQSPAQATTLFHGGRPAVILSPDAGASGTDELRFRVTTSGGESGEATITIVYAQEACRADLTGDGVLDFFDFLEFQNLFAAGDPRADFDDNGILDFFDFLAFQTEFAAGCP
ncbi:MAG: TIGR03790 family protein [Phycisphaerales bacterium JB039]